MWDISHLSTRGQGTRVLNTQKACDCARASLSRENYYRVFTILSDHHGSLLIWQPGASQVVDTHISKDKHTKCGRGTS